MGLYAGELAGALTAENVIGLASSGIPHAVTCGCRLSGRLARWFGDTMYFYESVNMTIEDLPQNDICSTKLHTAYLHVPGGAQSRDSQRRASSRGGGACRRPRRGHHEDAPAVQHWPNQCSISAVVDSGSPMVAFLFTHWGGPSVSASCVIWLELESLSRGASSQLMLSKSSSLNGYCSSAHSAFHPVDRNQILSLSPAMHA
jgi:hypothetical protein